MIFENDNKLKFERLKSMPKLKQEIISHLFDQVSRRERDRWWHYKGEFKHDGNDYAIECDCRWDNQMFTYRNLYIEHKQIEIDIEDAFRKGLLQ